MEKELILKMMDQGNFLISRISVHVYLTDEVSKDGLFWCQNGCFQNNFKHGNEHRVGPQIVKYVEVREGKLVRITRIKNPLIVKYRLQWNGL